MKYCPICHEAIWASDGPHKCANAWKVWDAEDQGPEDAITIYAPSFRAAAEKWAEQSDDRGDHKIAQHGEGHAVVSGQGSVRQFRISAEIEVTYSAVEEIVTPEAVA